MDSVHENLDRMVLCKLHDTAAGGCWKSNMNWVSELPLRVWKGVSVDNIEVDDAHVTRLDLASNGLDGFIDETIGKLKNLTMLRLSNNSLKGGIPSSIGSLQNLLELRLHDNTLSGCIPEELGMLTRLTYLSLKRNNLEGIIPESLGNLRHLKHLWLHMNSLQGPVPASFGNLTKIKTLLLSHNNLTGSLPSGLAHLENLEQLLVHRNRLSGEIPVGVVKLILRIRTNGKSKRSPVGPKFEEDCVVLHSNPGLTLPTDLQDVDPVAAEEALDLGSHPMRGNWRAAAAMLPHYDWLDEVEIV